MAVQNQVAGTVKQRRCAASWGGCLMSPNYSFERQTCIRLVKTGRNDILAQRRRLWLSSEGRYRGKSRCCRWRESGGIRPKKGYCDIDSCGQAKGSRALVSQSGASLPISR